jgi:hypothetical protein
VKYELPISIPVKHPALLEGWVFYWKGMVRSFGNITIGGVE